MQSRWISCLGLSLSLVLGACDFCGNGKVKPPEECDDGNVASGDGCDNRCRNEECGNGRLDAGEECDDDNAVNGDGCSALCTDEVCGDGDVQAGLGEECDDGNTSAGDGCNAQCQLEECGDGVDNNGNTEACDDGNQSNNDSCLATCVLASCGDGFTFDQGGGTEECDNGAANSDTTPNACRTDCALAGCGDGVVDTGEECDDGDNVDADGCEANCTNPACNNDIIDPGEVCLDEDAPVVLSTLPATGLPGRMDIGDVNGDGNLDIVVPTRNNPNNVNILLGQGNGQFNLATTVILPDGINADAVKLGDLDGEGDLEIAVVSFGDNSVNVLPKVIFLTNQGNGLFQTNVSTIFNCVPGPFGVGCSSLDLGDLDGDGDLDVAATTPFVAAGGVQLYINQGGFNFTERFLDITVGASFIAMADLDGEGDLDIYTANPGVNENNAPVVNVLPNLGNAQFAATKSFFVASWPFAVIAADLTGDGLLDLASANGANTSGNNITILENQGGSNAGISFANIATVTTGLVPGSIEAEDLDGDGRKDLIYANNGANTVSVRLNQGFVNNLLTFTSPVNLATQQSPILGPLFDLDEDGSLDIAATNRNSDTISIFLNRP